MCIFENEYFYVYFVLIISYLKYYYSFVGINYTLIEPTTANNVSEKPYYYNTYDVVVKESRPPSKRSFFKDNSLVA